jgi:transposase-like protein
MLGVPITKLGIPPSTIYYTRKLGVRKRREIRPNCPSCKSDKVIKNGSSRGKTKYKCNVCRRTFYDANSHRMKQKERILKEYLNRMSIIAKVEGKPLTTV